MSLVIYLCLGEKGKVGFEILKGYSLGTVGGLHKTCHQMGNKDGEVMAERPKTPLGNVNKEIREGQGWIV